MSTLRFATVNVFSFRKPSTFESNITDLVSILQPFDLDFIAVQEIQNDDKWKKFVSRLGWNYSIFGDADGVYFGNGIASRHEISFSKNQMSSSNAPGGRRGFLQWSLKNFPQIKFAVTHLDHMNENDRLVQIQEFNPIEQNIDILMGDMNALTREDYTDDYYRKTVEGKRRESFWEMPRFDLTSLLTNEWQYQDVFKFINPNLKNEEIVTCSYGTRIDYVYFHSRFLNTQCTIKNCQIIETKNATDHNGIFVEFEIK